MQNYRLQLYLSSQFFNAGTGSLRLASQEQLAPVETIAPPCYKIYMGFCNDIQILSFLVSIVYNMKV